jgi:hypothetical protein
MFAYYPPECESLQSRIVGRWCPSFTGATGLQLPDTVGRNHGTLTNFANNGNDAYVANPDRLALNFDGADDYVAVPYSPSFNVSSVTLSIWINRRAAQFFGHPVCKPFFDAAWSPPYVEYALEYNATSDNLQFILGRTDGFSLIQTSTIGNNAWFHAIGTYDGSTSRLYLDGSLRVSQAFNTPMVHRQTALYFGAENTQAQYRFNGFCDDITIYNTALTANEVRFIYEQGRGGGLLYQPPRRRSVAAIIAALVLACETANYSLTGQAAGLFASRLLAADQAEHLLSGNAADITASRLLSADPASYTATGNDAATICARLLDGGAAAYALTGTDAGLIANRKLTADQAVYFLAGNNAELLRSLKLNAGSMSLELDNLAASLLADRKISADGAQYLLVASDANLGDSASGVAPYYYLFMMRGPQ